MYINGFCAPVPSDQKDTYVEHAKFAAGIMREYGATRSVEGWGDNVPDGEVTSFPMAVKCKADETVVFGWAEWPDKEACESGMQKFMSDPRLQDFSPPFDGKRLIWGSFEAVVNE